MEIGDKEAKSAELYELDKGSKEYKYLMERRKVLGGGLPARIVNPSKLKTPELSFLKKCLTEPK